jgi:uncharacterized protein YyaL (SSP411 family)
MHSYKKGKATINGFLEDYSFTIEALLALYQSTFDEHWLNEAKQLADYSVKHFYDSASGMFWFTSDLSPALIARKKEINDNVIPASNSSMAKALFYLGIYFEDKKFSDIASQMLLNVKDVMPAYGSGHSNWGILLLHFTSPFNEIVIAGKDAEQKRKELAQYYLPNKIIAGATSPLTPLLQERGTVLPLLQDRYVEGKTLIYVCENRTCKLPVEKVTDAVKQLR